MKVQQAIGWVREHCQYDSIYSIAKAINYPNDKFLRVINGIKINLPKEHHADLVKVVEARKNRMV
jgi:hypothetical protein